MALTMVVLPTPGPPVITRTFDNRASRMAAVWLSASDRPVLRSIHGIALSGSMGDQGSVPAIKCRSRSAMTCSARYRPPRKTQGVASTVSAITVPSASSSSSAAATSSFGISSNSAASGTNSSVGRPQWPSSIASVSAYEIPARTRTMPSSRCRA